jgi:transposase-like protein
MAEYSFKEPRFHDAAAAREYLEMVRWPNGPVCPHCGAFDRITKLAGKSHRPGLYDCGHCRDQFTVTVGTVFERSKISLDKWVFAATLMACSKKGISSKQIERMLGVTYKTAWFMTRRLREAMKAPGGMFGSGSAPVEADATYIGGKEHNKHANKRKTQKGRGAVGKQCVFSLVERDGGVRSFHIPVVDGKSLKPIITQQLNAKTRLMTDGERALLVTKQWVASHETVNHLAREYVRGDVTRTPWRGTFRFSRGVSLERSIA